MERYLHLLSRGDKIGLTLIRLSIAIVFMWIGLLKFVPYEADSITPFVANSPLMSFFYEHPEDYKQYLTHEGEYKPEARAWQTANNTYGFSNGLGVVEVIIALLVLEIGVKTLYAKAILKTAPLKKLYSVIIQVCLQ